MAMHLMFTGALDRFSGIRFILSHAGGTLPYLAWRLFNRQVANPDLPPQWTYEQYCMAMRRFWYDTAMSVGPEMLKCLFSIVGTERVVFGSDWPYLNDKAVKIEVKGLAAPGLLSDAQAAQSRVATPHPCSRDSRTRQRWRAHSCLARRRERTGAAPRATYRIQHAPRKRK